MGAPMHLLSLAALGPLILLEALISELLVADSFTNFLALVNIRAYSRFSWPS